MTLFYNGGQGRYRLEKVLQPGQQLWLDVGQLIRNQVPDSDGKTLPPDTMTGSYELRDLDHAAVGLLYEGKLIIDKTYGHASYGCGTCCGYVKAQVWVTPFSGPPSINNTDYYQAEEQCGGAWDDFTSIATSWQSSNTAVATLPSRTLHTVAPGTATGSAEAYLQGSRPAPACPMIWMAGQQQLNVQPHISSVDPTIATIGSNGVQITINGSGFGTTPTVNLPGGFSNTGQASSNTRIVVTVNIGYAATVGNNSISVTGPTGTSNSASFTANGPSMMIVQQNGDVIGTTTNDPTAQSRFVTYQVQNVDKTAAANIPIAEDLSRTGYNCSLPDPGYVYAHCDGTHHTNASGILQDEWGMFTGYSPVSCGVNMLDHWQWCSPSGPTSGKTFGTLSGWIHTASSDINSYINPPTPMPGGFVILP